MWNLGPLLFNFYINDLTFCVSNTLVRLYADDTTLYCSVVSLIILEYFLNSDPHLLSAWFDNNYLKVYRQKQCQLETYLMMTPSSAQGKRKPYITDSMNILGVVLDRKLARNDQIIEQIKKACDKASALIKTFAVIPQDSMVRLYKSRRHPTAPSCGVLWSAVNRCWEHASQKTWGN